MQKYSEEIEIKARVLTKDKRKIIRIGSSSHCSLIPSFVAHMKKFFKEALYVTQYEIEDMVTGKRYILLEPIETNPTKGDYP